jgi:hypothetical protein
LSKALVPEFADALRELEELGLHNVDLPEALEELANEGLPLLTSEIDQAATEATGDMRLVFKLSDQVHVKLAAVRARKSKSELIEVTHGDSLST